MWSVAALVSGSDDDRRRDGDDHDRPPSDTVIASPAHLN
jgi:hypothetical protein